MVQCRIGYPKDHFFDTFNPRGEYIHISMSLDLHAFIMEHEKSSTGYNISLIATCSIEIDYTKYRDYFLHSSIYVIKCTFKATTQYARAGWISGHIYDTYKSPFPALNVIRSNEAVATDTVYLDIAAIDNGSLCAQFFMGLDTSFCNVFGMKTDKQFINFLLNVNRKRVAMDKLVSNRA